MITAKTRAYGHSSTDDLPKGLGVVLAEQRMGFWSRPGDGSAQPEFSEGDVPSRIYTFEPWLGCLWGTSCTFCYVPNLSAGHYPGGHQSGWVKGWGRWLVPKPDISERLRHQLFSTNGRTRPKYSGAFVFMSAKTDPFLPRTDLLRITRSNLAVFAQADVFLMCQTRSPAVVEDAEILELLCHLANQKKAAVSFSIATDVRAEQLRIERGGMSPERRLRTMERLKSVGIFVSAAVSPLMPYSAEFPRRLLDCAHHASIQTLRPSGFGSATPKNVLDEIYRSVPGYQQLGTRLADSLQCRDTDGEFSWGMGNKGFIGAFLAAGRFYGPADSRKTPRQLPFADRRCEVSPGFQYLKS